MTFSITVDTERWRANATAVHAAVTAATSPTGGVVPVIKGRGYGLGNAALALEAGRLGVHAIAVGTVFEAREVLDSFAGDVVVLEPYEPRDTATASRWAELDTTRVIRTIASESGWHAAIDSASSDSSRTPVRVVLEGLTSMHRFGLDPSDVARLLTDPRIGEFVAVEGLALHLPLVQPAAKRPTPGLVTSSDTGIVERGSARAREAIGWALMYTSMLDDRRAAPVGEGAATLWVSHLTDDEVTSVRAALPELPINARIGTRLWHGDRGSLQATGTVLAVHVTDREVGYRQRRTSSGGSVIVVSGGTSHGVALTAPSSVTSMKARLTAAGNGALESAGRSRSPFTWRGEALWFVEPPHVSVSMLRLPRGVVPPAVGDQLPCEVRYTTTAADEVRFA